MCVSCFYCRRNPKYHGIDGNDDDKRWKKKKHKKLRRDHSEKAVKTNGTNGHPNWDISESHVNRTVRAQTPHHPTPSFYETTRALAVQPAADDVMAYESVQAGTVVMPTNIPEVPLDSSGDLGTIFFSIQYDVFTQELKILVKKAERLPAKDMFGTSDPFVKIILLPNKKHKMETRVKKKKLNPSWNEVFTFEGFPHEKLIQRVLFLQVLDYDRFSRDDEIGEVEVPLVDISLQKEPVDFVRELRPCKNATGCLGDLLISMCYKPNAGHLTVIIMKCSRLKPMDLSGKSDPYIKVHLMNQGRRVVKRKTSTKERSLNPVWNEVMVFEVPFFKARDVQFIFTVMDYDRHLPNKTIGQVIIGSRLAGTAVKHWTDMMNAPRKSVAMWHRIVKY